jgi:hypothetical protein
MVRIKISDLDEAVKAFLAPAQLGQTIVVEDDAGRVQCGITPYIQASPTEKLAALAALERLQQRSADALQQNGVSEVDVDRELQN